MNQHTPLRTGGSLLERAAELYGFGLDAPAPKAPAPAPEAPAAPEPRPRPAPQALKPAPAQQPKPASLAPERQPAAAAAPAKAAAAPAATAKAPPAPARTAAASEPRPEIAKPVAPPTGEELAPAQRLRPARQAPLPAGEGAKIDRDSLREAGFIEPDAPGGGLAEEFRIVKRQLLLDMSGEGGKARTILVCSAQPDEGKTFCAVNLAFSLAAEREREVLLIDADFPKPEILSILGLEGGAGLVDALAEPDIDPESLVIRTDVEGLSVLPAGRHVANITELLAAERTREVLARLAEANPRRILLFDAPPALLASPASALATHAGQLLLVVRADQTTESDLREAAALLSACPNIRLLLNGAGFAATGRRFGSYYGYGQ
jgi:protein-tyrosine kinase